MIPRHAPPLPLRTATRLSLFQRAMSQEQFESACASMLGVRHVLLLPSARVGILLATRAVMTPETVVVGPAFVCAVVHEAMTLSGASLRFVDSAPGGFLMNPAALPPLAGSPWVGVWSDIYGLPCDRDVPRSTSPPVLRLWDMAMSVPEASAFARLQSNDAALLSFGLGKCLYSGWGGALLCNDSTLFHRIRAERDRWVTAEIPSTRIRHAISVFGRTVAHNRCLYALGRYAADRRNTRLRAAVARHQTEAVAHATPPNRLDRAWTEPMTALNRKLAWANLQQAAQSAALRQRQAEQYRRHLEPLGLVRGFGENAFPQSHFPICVAPAQRLAVRAYLRRHGIDTGTLFPFPAQLRREDYPHAARAAAEVVLLPLGQVLRIEEVEMVARRVREALEASDRKQRPA
ncbi:MAG: DegT/DnrJ/EryC1/StrS family aminotransferase [Thermoguttaceae bacterium]